jgi:hypothetical protein
MDSRVFVHRIDAEDRISHVNRAWLDFASENDAGTLDEKSVLGRSLWSFFTDLSTRHIYEVLVHQVRETGTEVELPFRCDSPAMRRHMRVTIRPGEGGTVEFASRVLRAEPRDPVAVLDFLSNRGRPHVVMCSWCKNVETAEGWQEVEDAVSTLDLLEAPVPPPITHGICPTCRDRLWPG